MDTSTVITPKLWVWWCTISLVVRAGTGTGFARNGMEYSSTLSLGLDFLSALASFYNTNGDFICLQAIAPFLHSQDRRQFSYY